MPFSQLANTALNTIRKFSLISDREKILIGLSGGPDSVCLLHILKEIQDYMKLDLIAIYIDHGLRPDETPHEIEFSRELCDKLQVTFLLKSIDVKNYSETQKINKQEAARNLRYWMLEETAFTTKADRIALAHTADDQAETVFMRIMRGSGPTGLGGIPPKRGNIIRPLIETSRDEIESFLDDNNITFLIDSSNIRKDYLRNKIRLSLFPLLKEINPDIVKTLSKTSDIFRDEERYFGTIVTKTLMKMISRKTESRIELFLTPFEIMDTVIMRRVLRRALDETKSLRGMGLLHIEDIMKLIRNGNPGDRIYLPKGIRVIKEYSTLIITAEAPQKLGVYRLDVPGEVVLKESKAVIKTFLEEGNDTFVDGKTMIVLDAEKTGTSLAIRPRMRGDFFYPIGFGKKKKIQDFFVDQKIPRDERDRVPLVLSGDDIIWVVGYRGDERFKVTENTKSIVLLEVKKARD
jgi:tRNA(Ile)-lysidine synthase